jgi:hypothetical protein
MALMPVTPKLVDAHVCSTMQEKDDFHHGWILLVFEVTSAYAALFISGSATCGGVAGSAVTSTS